MKEVDRMVGSRFDLEIDYTKIGRKVQKELREGFASFSPDFKRKFSAR